MNEYGKNMLSSSTYAYSDLPAVTARSVSTFHVSVVER